MCKANTPEMSETIQKDWFRAVEVYNRLDFRAASTFLSTHYAKELGLGEDDVREFRRAVQSFDAKWQAAARAYKEGKFATRKKFVSSGKFLKMGFSPSREHAEILRFALKFYEEERLYRQNASSEEVSTVGRWGGTMKPMFVENKQRILGTVVGFETQEMPTGEDDRSIPSLVHVDDDNSAASSSRNSGASSVTCSLSEHGTMKTRRPREDDIDVLLNEFSDHVDGDNPLNALMYLLFAILPIIVFAKAWYIAKQALGGHLNSEDDEEGPSDIETVWEEMRAEAMCVIGDMA